MRQNAHPAFSIRPSCVKAETLSSGPISRTIWPSLNLSTVAPLNFSVEVNTISGIPGAALPPSGAVAVFLSSISAEMSPTDYSALISWGDGQTTVGTVGGGPTAFTVFGSHTYTLPGSYTTGNSRKVFSQRVPVWFIR